MNIGTVIEDGGASRLGRYGRDLENVVWPTREVRFVATQEFFPFSGESKIAVSIIAPEIQPRSASSIIFTPKKPRLAPYGLEVHFDKEKHRLATLFAQKACVVLALYQLDKRRVTREQFYHDVCGLPDKVLKKAKPVLVLSHSEEKREAGKVF